MKIHLFGYSNPVGQAFLDLFSNKKNNINLYSKKDKNVNYLDLENNVIDLSLKIGKPAVLVSFAPIWLFSSFLERLERQTSLLRNVDMIICCSSSSSVTKRYSFNQFDKELSKSLYNSEEIIKNLSFKNNIKCKIIKPALIYGNVGKFKDKNINLIKRAICLLPFLILPNKSGLRQPIHAKDLATFVYSLIKNKKNQLNNPDILIGGVETFTYIEMLERIRSKLPKNKYSKFCIFIKIPNRLFNFLMSPLILFSPKLYESILRICINLSGFETFEIDPKNRNFNKFPRE